MRNSIQDFSLANPIYAGATVSFYTVSAGVKTTTLATLYSGLTGTTTLTNPQTLDSDGKFQQPVYVDAPVIATVSGLTIADHDTGIIQAVLSAGSVADVLTTFSASSGSSLIGTIQAGVGAVASTVQAKLRKWIFVMDFAVAGDGVTDDTAGIQAAITAAAGRSLYFPSGTYKITAPLNINSAGTWLRGESAGIGAGHTVGAVILNTGAGDAVKFENLGAGGTTLHGCGIEHITITRSANAAAGSGLHLIDTSNFSLNNVHVAEHNVCYDLEDAQSTKFNTFSAYAGTYLTSGAALLHIRPLTAFAGAGVDAGWINEFSNFSLTCANNVTRCLDIAGGDAMLFSNGYVGDADVEHCRILGAATVPMYTILFSNVYFDGVRVDGTGTPIAVRHYSDGDASTRSADIRFTGCTFGQLDTAIYFDEPDAITLNVVGCEFHNHRDSCIYISSADVAASIVGNTFYDVGTAIANSAAVSVDDCATLTITGNSIAKMDLGTNKAIKLSGTLGVVTITGNAFTDCDNDLTNTATITQFTVAGNTSNNATNTVMGARLGNVVNADASVLDWYEEGTFAPVLTFATPGDLSVAYTTQVARYTRVGNRIHAQIDITTSAFTHTTASGNLKITGMPAGITPRATGARWLGALDFSGITKATYTNFTMLAAASDVALYVAAGGSAVAAALVAAADVPTGGSVILRSQLTWEV